MVKYDRETAQRGQRHIEDQRGSGPRRRRSAGGSGMPMGKVGGLGGIIIAVIALLLGGQQLSSSGGTSSGFDIGATGLEETNQLDVGSEVAAPIEDETLLFMGFLMEDIQTVWDAEFQEAGIDYQYTSMVIFENSVQTGCGNATSAVGPFYCPAPGDNRVYIDLIFYNELARKFGAPGDFAQAYVIAHEVGHHLQSVLGISDSVRNAQQQDPSAKNELSVRQELQADCFAGVWAHSANTRTTSTGERIIEEGDIEEGLRAAASVGDDRIQSQAGMQVDPHTWTHGSASARQSWFMKGFRSGDAEQCDTYAVSSDEVGL